jgi:hypothetical protein
MGIRPQEVKTVGRGALSAAWPVAKEAATA